MSTTIATEARRNDVSILAILEKDYFNLSDQLTIALVRRFLTEFALRFPTFEIVRDHRDVR